MRRLLLVLPLAGCLNLDSFAYNPVHCSHVTEATCNDGEPWDQVCLSCDEPYDWSRTYDWLEPALGDMELRPIPGVVNERLTTEDGAGELDLYFLPSHGEVTALADTTIVYSHGNYASVEHYAPRARLLWEAGYNVLIWDYRGYGKSDPVDTPTGAQFLADARQVRAHADTIAPDPDRILIYGMSLGVVPASEMAVADRGCALFIEVPWTSLERIMKTSTGARMGDGMFSSGSNFDNVERLKGYDGPTFAIAGEKDALFGPEEVERLYDGLAGPKELWITPDAEHGVGRGPPERALQEYYSRMTGFLEQHAPTCLAP